MEVVYRRCCGIDVHKDFITACVLVNEPGKQREVRKKEFRTYWSDLQKLKLWLYALESRTGCYGIDRRLLETGLECPGGSLSAAFGKPVPYAEHSRTEDRPERLRMDQRPAGTRAVEAQFCAPATGTRVEGSDTLSGETDGGTQPSPRPH